MKLTVIGSQGAYPAVDNPTSGYLIQKDGFSLMLDFGSGVLINLQNTLAINSLDAVILSHYHADHIADIGCLQYAVKVQTDLGIRKEALPIHGMETADKFKSLAYHDYTLACAVSAGSELQLGPFTAEFLETNHPDGGFSIRISDGSSRLVYTGDTGWNDALVEFAAGCDVLLCECSIFNRFKGRVKGHLTADEAGTLAERTGCGKLLLCHFPHLGTREELEAEVAESFRGQLELAMPGNVYNLTINNVDS